MLLPGEVTARPGAEVLRGVPRHRKAEMCPREETHGLDRLPSGMRPRAVGQELSVKGSTISIKRGVFKQKHREQVSVLIADKLAVTRGSQEPSPTFSRGAVARCQLTQCSGDFIEHNDLK